MNFNKKDKVIIINTDSIWENKEGIILADFDAEEITDETETYLVKIYFDDDKDKTIIQPFDKNNLKLAEVNEYLTESKKSTLEDFIYNYVHIFDLDDNEIDSWFFVDKIATAEDISKEDILEAAKKLGYKIFILTQNHFKRYIVAAPKCKIDSIYTDYADYLLGFAEVVEYDK